MHVAVRETYFKFWGEYSQRPKVLNCCRLPNCVPFAVWMHELYPLRRTGIPSFIDLNLFRIDFLLKSYLKCTKRST